MGRSARQPAAQGATARDTIPLRGGATRRGARTRPRNAELVVTRARAHGQRCLMGLLLHVRDPQAAERLCRCASRGLLFGRLPAATVRRVAEPAETRRPPRPSRRIERCCCRRPLRALPLANLQRQPMDTHRGALQLGATRLRHAALRQHTIPVRVSLRVGLVRCALPLARTRPGTLCKQRHTHAHRESTGRRQPTRP